MVKESVFFDAGDNSIAVVIADRQVGAPAIRVNDRAPFFLSGLILQYCSQRLLKCLLVDVMRCKYCYTYTDFKIIMAACQDVDNF